VAILTFPNIIPNSAIFGIKYSTQISTPSAISGRLQTVEMPGARWKGNMSFSDMTLSDSAALKAFLLELRGSSGTFFYNDASHTSPFNTVTGSPTLAGASTARTIRVTLGSSSPPFLPGDFATIGADDQREYKMIISSTIVAGDTFDLVIEPMIRRIDFVGKTLTYTNPKGVFMLTSDDQAIWGLRSKANLSDINLEFIEVFL